MAEGLQLPVGQVPDEWKVLPLKDVTLKIGSGSTPRGGASVYVEAGTSFIRSQNVLDHGFSLDGLVRIDDEAAYSLRGVEVLEGDVLINITGDSILRTCIVPNEVLPARVSQHVAILRSNGLIEPQVLQKWLSLEVMKDFMLGHSSGGTRKAVTKGDLERFPVPVPPLAEQRAIAGVLGALDDKIESNRRIVRTAREFIDALFCTAFSDGEINVQVSSLAEVVDCLHTKKPDQALEGKQLLQLSNISDDGFLILGNHYPISLDDYNKWTANIEVTEGDVILTNVGRVGALARVPKGVKSALGRNMTAIRARKPSDALFIFAALNNAQVRRGMKSLIDVGTIMDALNVHAIRRILLPESTVLQRDNFASAIGAVVERAEVAVKESSGLESLRDALLPELLSGRLRVKDAESMMENV